MGIYLNGDAMNKIDCIEQRDWNYLQNAMYFVFLNLEEMNTYF